MPAVYVYIYIYIEFHELARHVSSGKFEIYSRVEKKVDDGKLDYS